MRLDNFVRFDPAADKGTDIPEVPGNYLVLIRDYEKFPNLDYDTSFQVFQGMDVIYTGVAGSSLRSRIWKNHLSGNAGHSTLRLSLGCLMGYTLIPRDKKDPDNGHVRFDDNDERELTAWMKENLIFYYMPFDMPEVLENELIERLNPPLNLLKNFNEENMEFRLALSDLRKKKPWLTEAEVETPGPDFNTPLCKVFRFDINDFSMGWEEISFQFDHVTVSLSICDAGPEVLTTLIHAAVNLTGDPADESFFADWSAESGDIHLGIYREGDSILICMDWGEIDEEGERQTYHHQHKIRLRDFLSEIRREAVEMLQQYGLIGFGANWAMQNDTYDTFPLASLLKLEGAKVLLCDESPFPCSHISDELSVLKRLLGLK